MRIKITLLLLLMQMSFGGYLYSDIIGIETRPMPLTDLLSPEDFILSGIEKTIQDTMHNEPDTLIEITPSVLKRLFPVIHEFPKNIEDVAKMQKEELPRAVVAKYLQQIKNDVEYRGSHKPRYRAIGSIEYGSNVYLLYDVTNGYDYELYLCLHPQNNPYPRTLKIFKSTGGCEIYFSIEDGEIMLCEYSEVSEITSERRYIYKLDSKFTHIKTTDLIRVKEMEYKDYKY
ncbi:MAG: hypothetical protein ACI30P_02455 [Muribaculaceae bacterium]